MLREMNIAVVALLLPATMLLLQVAAFSTDLGSGPLYEDGRLEALQDLGRSLRAQPIERRARNVIFYIGDGMGVTTLTAARILKGQVENGGEGGEEAFLSFERFENVAALKTYSYSHQVTDSAASASAYFTGRKCNSDVHGMDASAMFNASCEARGAELVSIIELAQALGKSTGIISTARITHATPAATYSNSASREWENDAAVPQEDRACQTDIARQLIEDRPGRNLDVILGGGLRNFRMEDDGGRRQDEDLVERWQAANPRSQFVSTREELLRVDVESTERLLGLFASSHLDYIVNRPTSSVINASTYRFLDHVDDFVHPTLVDMVDVAVRMLQRNDNGFVLIVEGGRIDHGHHGTHAARALHEVLDLEKAIEHADGMTDREETLSIVTADHSHAFTVAGYSERGAPILGEGTPGYDKVTDGPYLTLQYSNGPNQVEEPRVNPLTSGDPLADPKYQRQTARYINSETHGGEEVLLYARGPFAHLFRGLHENTYPFHVLAYAACMPVPRDNYERLWERQRGDSGTVDWQRLELLIDPRLYAHCRRTIPSVRNPFSRVSAAPARQASSFFTIGVVLLFFQLS